MCAFYSELPSLTEGGVGSRGRPTPGAVPRSLSHGPLGEALHAFLLSREAMRCSPKTLEHYRYTLGAFLAHLAAQGVDRMEAVAPAHIRGHLVALQRRGLQDTTQHAHARGIKTWLRWLVAEGLLEASPMDRVQMPRLEQRIPAPFSAEDVQALLDACNPETPTGARDHAVVLALLDTGLRLGELCSLRVGAILPDSGLVGVLGKGRKQRFVRVGSGARAAIAAMLALRPSAAPGDALWATAEGKPLTPHGVQSMLVRLGKKAGVYPCGPHRFRRTFALWCLRDGMDLENLRRIMGHATLTVLQRYLALDVGDVERAHTAHSPVDSILRRAQDGPTAPSRAEGLAHADLPGAPATPGSRNGRRPVVTGRRHKAQRVRRAPARHLP